MNAAQVVKPAQERHSATGSVIPAEAALESAQLKVHTSVYFTCAPGNRVAPGAATGLAPAGGCIRCRGRTPCAALGGTVRVARRVDVHNLDFPELSRRAWEPDGKIRDVPSQV